jgi:hypothetical protein
VRTLQTQSTESRWRRDLRILWRMAGMLAIYWTVGARLRRRYRRKAARGEMLWVDEEGSSRHREAPLHRR